MNNNFKSYHSYKNENILWLDRIPVHWDLLNNKEIWEERIEKNNINEELLSVTIKRGIIKQKELIESSSKKDSSNVDKSNYKLVEEEDIVYNKMRMWQGAVGKSKYRGIVSPAYIVLKPRREVNTGYFHYLYRTPAYVKEAHRFSYGICDDQLNLRYEDFKKMKTIMPPIQEQNQIVKYLDYNISQITKFINLKKKFILALKEQKQAVVNEAVTKGLNPNVKMKFSGFNWIGDIPAHWEVKPLRQLLKPFSLKNRPDLPLLSVVREKGVVLREGMSREENHNFIPDDLSGYKVVEVGQFAMNKMKAWQGSYGISAYQGIVSPAYYIFNVNFKNLNYFHLAIRSKVYVNFFYRASDGIRTGQWDLSLDKMKEIPFFVPPEEEQKDINEYIPKELQRIEDAITKLEHEIQLVEEYKTRLISDIVTGKFTVQGIEVPSIKENELQFEDKEELDEEFEGEEVEVL